MRIPTTEASSLSGGRAYVRGPTAGKGYENGGAETPVAAASSPHELHPISRA